MPVRRLGARDEVALAAERVLEKKPQSADERAEDRTADYSDARGVTNEVGIIACGSGKSSQRKSTGKRPDQRAACKPRE